MTNPEGPESPGDTQFASLIAEYHDDALRVARRLVRSSAEAEDLTQTAILNVLRHANNIEDSAHIKAYLLTAVRNLWRNQLRQRGRRRFVGADAADHLPSEDLGPEEQALNLLDAALARVAFSSLSETSRQILSLRYIDGFGFVELAEQLGISAVAARQRAHRAREELIGACIEHIAVTDNGGSCSRVRSRLGRYLRGRLSRKSRVQIEAHIDVCSGCAQYYAEVVDLYGHLLWNGRSRDGS
jgi:RNA polymerase sigma-70 factor (ECF subfamily)